MEAALRVLIGAASDDDARRAQALVDGCGFEATRVRSERPERLREGLTDEVEVLVAVCLAGTAGLAVARAAAEAAGSAVPLVALADEASGELLEAVYAAGGRVCLFGHGPGPLRQALLRARAEAAARRERAGVEREQEQARASEQVHALVFDHVSDVIFTLGVEGDRFRFLEINPMFTQATGLTEAEVVGKLVDEVIPEPSLPEVLARYREALATRRTVRWEEITEYPRGKKYGEVSVTPVIGPGGRCTHLLGTVRDVTEARQREETIQLYVDIVRMVQIGLLVWRVGDPGDLDTFTLEAFNPAAERTAGFALSSRLGERLLSVFPAARDTDVSEAVLAVAGGEPSRDLPAYSSEVSRRRAQVFSIKVFSLPGRRVGLAVEDVSRQAKAQALSAVEQRVLELVASGATLQQTLTELVLVIEAQAPPAIASVLLLSADGKRLLRGAAPHLPEEYSRAIHEAPIRPPAGSCGTAAAQRRLVVVTDTHDDPLWEPYRDLARRFSLRACWSTPILGSDGRVLGTFALYYSEVRAPSEEDLELIARATHVAGIALQRHELDEQLRALSARIESAREDERTGIAREIHDQLGQALTVFKMDLAWIGRRAAAKGGIAQQILLDKLTEMSRSTDEVIDQVRRISSELRPGVLDDIGLSAALSWQAREFEKRTGIGCSFRPEVDDRTLRRDLSTAVFRVFQEALTNVARHASATHVEALLAEDNGWLVLGVRDDGEGIRDEALSDARSLGLLGIRERARRLGGSASFARASPRGTEVTLRLPLGPAAGAA